MMENQALVSSSKPVFSLSSTSRYSSITIIKPHLSRSIRTLKAGSFISAQANFDPSSPPRVSKIRVLKRSGNNCLARISSSNSRETSSVGVNLLPAVPPPSSNFGSPLFWIGVGVGFSALFSWVASNLKKYAMQQAFKTMMGQMGSQNNQFNNAPFSPGSPFPTPASGSAISPPFSPYPAQGPATSPPFSAYPPGSVSSPPTAASQSVVNVDSSSTKEGPPAADVNKNSETERPKKIAFVDVSPDETLQKSPFGGFEGSTSSDLPKSADLNGQVAPNGSASQASGLGTFEQSSSSGKRSPGLSVEALEKMMEDPTVQKMVYPYLPEEMRNPTTFKWMLQNPQYRKQLEDMLNNMGGSAEWDNRMTDSLKNFDLTSPEVKQQFDQIGLSPEDVISKIMANPDVAMAFQNPRVQAAIMDCSQNPMSIAKYQNDKEVLIGCICPVMDVFYKITELFPGVTGSPP